MQYQTTKNRNKRFSPEIISNESPYYIVVKFIRTVNISESIETTLFISLLF